MIHRYKQCNLYFTLCLTLLCFSLLSLPIINGVFWRYLNYSNWREIIISVFMSRIKVLRTTWHCSKLADAFWHFLKGYWETQNNCSRPNLQLIEWNQNLKGEKQSIMYHAVFCQGHNLATNVPSPFLSSVCKEDDCSNSEVSLSFSHWGIKTCFQVCQARFPQSSTSATQLKCSTTPASLTATSLSCPAKPARAPFTPKPILPNTASISDQALHVIINVRFAFFYAPQRGSI